MLIGIVSAAIGYLYARVFYGTVALTHRIPGGPVLKPAIGGLLVGLLALEIPQILSSGYGWVQFAADKDTLMTIPLWIVLILPIAKIVATSLSIGTGGSGGIFGPGIVIGASSAPRSGASRNWPVRPESRTAPVFSSSSR